MRKQLYSDEKLERILQGAVRVLGEMGLRVQNRRCLEKLEEFGARINYPEMRAAMPEDCINRMLAIVRREQEGWEDSRPRLEPDMGIGSGGTCPWYFDDDEGKSRRANESDCIEAYKVVETSPAARSGPPVSNSDSHPNFEPIRIIQLGLETLNRTCLGPTDLFLPEQVPFAVELGQLVHDDPRYFLSSANCPNSPLDLSKIVADLALAKAPYKKDYSVPAMPIAGHGAPITPAGTAVIGVAEILSGYVLAKALDEETPVNSAALTARMDLKTGTVVYTAPEVFAADVAISEVFRYCLNLPCHLFGYYIDAKKPGMKALYEKFARSAGLGLYGNLSGVEGTLDQGKVFSNTQLMLDQEMYSFFASYTAEPAADEEELAVEEIIEIGWSGSGYLLSKHTMDRMKGVWDPALYTRDPEDEKKLLSRAREMWKENLEKYEPPNHSDDFLRSLGEICNRAKKVLR